MGSFPIDRQRFIDLNVLTCFYAPAAKNALLRIVAIESIAVILCVGLRAIGYRLVLNSQETLSVVDGAIAVVVVTNRAVEHVVAQDAMEAFLLRPYGTLCFGRDNHSVRDARSARSNQLTVDLNQASVAGLDRTELSVITNLRQLNVLAIDSLNQVFSAIRFISVAVNSHSDHSLCLPLSGSLCKSRGQLRIAS